MFSHISLERKCFWLEEDVEDVFMYWFCRLDSFSFAHCSYTASTFLCCYLLPATFCLPSVASHCCLFIALARLKFYASTGCVRIGFGSILSCLFVWLCVCLYGVCVVVWVCVFGVWLCLCSASTPRWMLTMRFDWCCLFLRLLPASSWSSSFLYSFATPLLLLLLRCLQSI